MLYFSLVIFFTCFLEIKFYKSYITPYTGIAIANYFLIIYNNLISIRYGFYSIDDDTLIKLSFFYLSIFGVSILYKTIFFNESKTRFLDYYIKSISAKLGILVVLFYIGLLARYISLFQSISRFGFDNIKGNSFGIFAHIGNLAIVISPFILLIVMQYKIKRYLILPWSLVFLNILLFGGKYGMIFFVLHNVLFISMIFQNKFINLFFKALLIVFIGIIIFILIYGVIPLLSTGDFTLEKLSERMDFILKHFSFYLTSPVVASAEMLRLPGSIHNGIEIIFTVPINIFRALSRSGLYIMPVIPNKIPVSFEYSTNVGGLIGELVFTGGYQIAFFVLILLYIIIYLFYTKAIFSSKYISLTSLLLSASILSFFCNFYTVFGVVIQFIILFIIEKFILNKEMRKIIYHEKISDNIIELER